MIALPGDIDRAVRMVAGVLKSAIDERVNTHGMPWISADEVVNAHVDEIRANFYDRNMLLNLIFALLDENQAQGPLCRF